MKNETLLIVSHKKHDADTSTGFVKVDGGFLPITNEIAGHFGRVILCVPVFGLPDPSSLQRYRSNVEICPLPAYRTRAEFIRQLPAIWRVLKLAASDADLIYSMGPNVMGAVGLAVARRAGKPVFASFDTDSLARVATSDYGFAKRTLKTLFIRWLIYPYFRLMAKSAPAFVTGDMFLGNYPAWHQWVKTTHTEEQIRPVGQLQLNPASPRLAFAGRLSPEKNLPTLLHALAHLHQQGLQATLTIIGSGPEEQSLRQLVEQLELQESVSFAGRVPSTELLDSRFLNADILILPSKEERQGKVLLEAMSCGIPVIASNAGGIPSVVEHGHNGLLFDPNSVEDLAGTAKRLVDNRELQQHLVQEGHLFAQRHTLEAGVKRLVTIVKDHYFAEKRLAA